ncbi:glycosyltransferase [Synechococcales cyanobacterium C]|uniref:Glycosyltransferase n=1 Tax=Petrachloros mirabilis ULC683 TaxID=2781853 RepID=A0A8K2A8K9_9CYAN|nr:glycosyltransferase family A protein [Petrachloros mirabilis]NCJ07299.1 glycosyltransferase [Petrachloros mirabilis ULC683]
MPPQVSIVIPAYNAMLFLPETLESVWQQTFQDYEVLVVNDGSTDDLEHWLEAQNNPRLYWINQPNQGQGVARNHGILQTSGEYIAFLDADDLWEPTKLAQQVDYLNQHKTVGLVYTWTALIDNEGQFTGRVIQSHVEGRVWRSFLTQNWIGCGSNPLIRRACFDEVGMFDLSPGIRGSEDWDMWLRLCQRFQFGLIKAPLVKYRLSETSISRDCDRMWCASRVVIEKQFLTASIDQLHLRGHSYSACALYLGWKATEISDARLAKYFWGQAYAHRLQSILTPKALRLLVAIILLQVLGGDRYQGLRNGWYTWRYHLKKRRSC